MTLQELKKLKEMDKDTYYIIKHFIKRNFKIQNKTFDETKVIKTIFYKLRKHKSKSKMYNVFTTFLKFIKDNYTYDDKEINFMLNNIPKPKYERKKWKTWKKIHDRLKFLKRLKRKVKKDIEKGEVHKIDKLNNIINEINELQKRKQELANKLK
jgi:hypothetical protein